MLSRKPDLTKYSKKLKYYSRIRLLFIDDFCISRYSEDGIKILYHLLKTRADLGYPTVFTSQHEPSAWGKKLSDDPEFHVRVRENNEGKMLIARKALELIQPHTSIFLDASTTNLLLAKSLPDINLNVITTGPSIALELAKLHNPVVTLCCGTLNRKSLALSGQNTLKMLESINIDLALIGVSGCSVDAGLTCGTEGDMLVKRLVIEKARTSVALCGHDKFSCLMPYTFAKIEDVDYLICDEPVPAQVKEVAQAAGIHLL